MTAKQDRGRQTIEYLLDAALDIFAEEGADGFTITAVVAKSGISVGSLYHHFGNFDGLTVTLYSRCMAEVLDTMIEAMNRTRTARTGIEAMVRAYLQWSIANRAKALVIQTAQYCEYRAPLKVAETKAPRIKLVTEWLEPHVQAGRIHAMSPQMIESLMVGPPALAVHRWLADVPGVNLTEALKVMPDRIWHSLQGPTP